MPVFSPQLTQWLNDHNKFVNTTLTDSPEARRSLGPASGNREDLYPFLSFNAFTGIFAGLSISGIKPESQSVYLIEFNSLLGFDPSLTLPGIPWQKMSSEDWLDHTPLNLSPQENALRYHELPVHEVDLRFEIYDGPILEGYTTATWPKYVARNLSQHYRLHHWTSDDEISVTAVVFRTSHATRVPFLVPCYVHALSGSKTELDPACLFAYRKPVRFFCDDLRVSAVFDGDNIMVKSSAPVKEDEMKPGLIETTAVARNAAEDVAATISRIGYVAADRVVSVAGVRPNSRGNISLVSTGAHSITCDCLSEEMCIDPLTNTVAIPPNKLTIRNTNKACCSCEEYADRYEELRGFFDKYSEYVVGYNDFYVSFKETCEKLAAILEERSRLIQPRLESKKLFVDPDNIDQMLMKCECALIYSNVFSEEYRHPTTRFELLSDEVNIKQVTVLYSPSNFDFHVTNYTTRTIDVSSVTSSPYNSKAVRLEIIFVPTVPITETFNPKIDWRVTSLETP